VGADSPARPSLDVGLLGSANIAAGASNQIVVPIDGPMILNVKHWKRIMWQCELAPRHHRTQLIVDGAVLGLFLIFGGCLPEYQAGDCIQNPKDGYIWRITAVEFGKYTAQGWVNGKWGLTVPMDSDVPKGPYVKVKCPFSTDVQQERR
jgi:hypothetical protein